MRENTLDESKAYHSGSGSCRKEIRGVLRRVLGGGKGDWAEARLIGGSESWGFRERPSENPLLFLFPLLEQNFVSEMQPEEPDCRLIKGFS